MFRRSQKNKNGNERNQSKILVLLRYLKDHSSNSVFFREQGKPVTVVNRNRTQRWSVAVLPPLHFIICPLLGFRKVA